MNKKVDDIRYYLKGVIWDILIDIYMQNAEFYDLEKMDECLEEIQELINRIDQKDILKFTKTLLSELEKLAKQENIAPKNDFEEVFLKP